MLDVGVYAVKQNTPQARILIDKGEVLSCICEEICGACRYSDLLKCVERTLSRLSVGWLGISVAAISEAATTGFHNMLASLRSLKDKPKFISKLTILCKPLKTSQVVALNNLVLTLQVYAIIC